MSLAKQLTIVVQNVQTATTTTGFAEASNLDLEKYGVYKLSFITRSLSTPNY